ncbi:MAG: HNH endonuclease signature motif containing protein [Acidobacteriota bacterium]
MTSFLEKLVWQRAQRMCEYCQMPQSYDELPFEIDHIIARKHSGQTTAPNLALCCFACNHRKGPNIAGVDPKTGRITRLFNPRRHKWEQHFKWNGPRLIGRTPIGRTTIAVLEINLPYRLELRQALIEEGVFPPTTEKRRATKRTRSK